MTFPPIIRLLRYGVLSAFVAGALYIMACMHVLSKLNETSLITNYISLPYSSTSPVYPFPIADWMTYFHWITFGRQQVFVVNQKSNDYIKYLPERIALAEQLSEPIDESRAQGLLIELVCSKRNDDQAIRDILAFQNKWPSQALGDAIRQCELISAVPRNGKPGSERGRLGVMK